MEIHESEDSIHDFAADILKINVDAVGNGSGEFGLPVGMFVVDGGIEAEILREPIAFIVRARDADHAAAANLSDLADDAACGACGGGNNERLILLGLCDFHAEESGEAVDAHVDQPGP